MFLNINMARFTGYELATRNILAKKASKPVESEPMNGKTVDDIPALLTEAPLVHLSPYQRHQLTDHYTKERLNKPRTEAKLGCQVSFSQVYLAKFICVGNHGVNGSS